MNLFAKESEVKRAFFSKQPIVVLLCKEACLQTNKLNFSFPSAIVTLLQDFDDVFPMKSLTVCHLLGELSIK